MLISRRFVVAGIGSTPIASALPAQASLARQELQVTASDGLRIHVRELAHQRPTNGRPVLLIHGARVPGIASFDLDVANGSFGAELARGLNRTVYIMDARGYGASERVAAMSRPASEHRPLSRGYEVVRDIDAAVRLMSERSGVRQVDIFGWAMGGTWAAYYASLWPERCAHLVALNALYGATTPQAMLGPASSTADRAHPDRLNPDNGAYALYTGSSLLSGWDASVPEADKSTWRDPAIASAYVAATLASDPESGLHKPPSFRAPLGAIEDSFYQAAGRRLYDASSISSDILLFRSERDFWSRPEDAMNLAHDAVRAHSVRIVIIPNATHFVHLDRPERGRNQLLREVIAFLGN